MRVIALQRPRRERVEPLGDPADGGMDYDGPEPGFNPLAKDLDDCGPVAGARNGRAAELQDDPARAVVGHGA